MRNINREKLLRSLAHSTLGRPSLLSPLPYQSIVALDQRFVFFGVLWSAVCESCMGRLVGLVGFYGGSTVRTFLF
jgi:hypothetical protein